MSMMVTRLYAICVTIDRQLSKQEEVWEVWEVWELDETCVVVI
jgi:hypothetical protein